MSPGRFLFVTWGGGGNVPPAIGLAQRLREAGHHVRFIASSVLADRVSAAGFAFRSNERVTQNRQTAIEDEMQEFVRVLAGPDLASAVVDEIAREPTDALIVDCMQLNALCAAELSGLPTAVFVHLLYEPWRMRPGLGEMLRGSVDATRRELGMPALTEDLVLAQLWDQREAALVVTPIEFDFPNPDLPANVRYVGPIFEEPTDSGWDAPWPADSTDPLVLVSFSSTYMHQEDAIRRTAEAVSSMPARSLVTLGEAVEGIDVPPGVVTRSWVPHAAVLPEASVVVTHAGHATVMAALAHGVPMVCMPMGRDQFANAQRVGEIGAGKTVSMDATSEEIGAAVRDVLEHDAYRMAAGQMAEVIHGYGNGSLAVAEAERFLADA